MSPEELIVKLERELEAGWPAPFWPQDDPRVRTQRLPERCRHGHDLAEHAVWKRTTKTVTYECRRCAWTPQPPRTRCKRGHPLAGNTVGPRNRCRVCGNLWNNGFIWPGQTPEQFADAVSALSPSTT